MFLLSSSSTDRCLEHLCGEIARAQFGFGRGAACMNVSLSGEGEPARMGEADIRCWSDDDDKLSLAICRSDWGLNSSDCIDNTLLPSSICQKCGGRVVGAPDCP